MNRPLNLEEIHSEILKVMDYVHEFCEKNSIVYYLGYGTLIGAVRHHGYIPWDDDFDIQMRREDFERFCSLFNSCSDNPYKLVKRDSLKEYTNGIPRIVNPNFKYISKGSIEGAKEQAGMGIFIDLYPLDNFGDNKSQASRIKKKIVKINTLYSIYANKKSSSNHIHDLFRIPLHYGLRYIYGEDYNLKVDKRIEDAIRKNTNQTDAFIGQVTWEPACDQYRKEWFKERILVPFEDRHYWIPKEYDKILRVTYGDYMQLPPAEERKAYHNYEIYTYIPDQLK